MSLFINTDGKNATVIDCNEIAMMRLAGHTIQLTFKSGEKIELVQVSRDSAKESLVLILSFMKESCANDVEFIKQNVKV